ncbi:MAG: hypothetical protein WKG07_41355 [Hymenobacter sp.]
MKGRRREMIREELHQELHAAFGPAPIHSEYGMTELLSQALLAGRGPLLLPTPNAGAATRPRRPFFHL